MVSQDLEQLFPGLVATPYKVTSAATVNYNCIAWAAGDSSRWWWPDEFDQYHWPEEVPRQRTLDAFVQAFASIGFEECRDASSEHGWEKVAIYAKSDGEPSHAARQLRDGTWTSKLGQLQDINHVEPDDVNGTDYGSPVRFLRRRRNDPNPSLGEAKP